METAEEPQQSAKILTEQADRILVKLDVDVSDVPIRDPTQEPWCSLPPIFAGAADAYDRLAHTEQRIKDRTVWERIKEADGRTADEIMRRLHQLHEEINPFH